MHSRTNELDVDDLDIVHDMYLNRLSDDDNVAESLQHQGRVHKHNFIGRRFFNELSKKLPFHVSPRFYGTHHV